MPREVLRRRLAALDDEEKALREELARAGDAARELEKLERLH